MIENEKSKCNISGLICYLLWNRTIAVIKSYFVLPKWSFIKMKNLSVVNKISDNPLSYLSGALVSNCLSWTCWTMLSLGKLFIQKIWIIYFRKKKPCSRNFRVTYYKALGGHATKLCQIAWGISKAYVIFFLKKGYVYFQLTMKIDSRHYNNKYN